MLAQMGPHRRVRDQFLDLGQQLIRCVAALLEEVIYQETQRHICEDKLPADRDGWDVGEPAAHNGKQLKAGHAGHSQIRNDEVGQDFAKYFQRRKTIRGGTNRKAETTNNGGGGFEYQRFVVYD